MLNQWKFVICSALVTAGIGVTHALAAGETGGVAVVELFTSEGCSSCPPADKLLATIVADAEKSHRNVIAIAWHVDYWDRLGWRDRFSSATATARQNQYATQANSDSVYTPQMIVNGQAKGFVGSDASQAHRAIDEAISAAATASVRVQSKRAGNDLSIEYDVAKAPKGAVLNVVAVEQGIQVKVMSGENGGRTLNHENVARAFKQVSLDEANAGKVKLTLPQDVKVERVKIVAFVATLPSMKIVGATEAAITAP